MPKSKPTKALKFAALVVMVLLFSIMAATFLKGENPSTVPSPQVASTSHQNTFFDPDPNHPWNQLYGMLFIRPGLDGKQYGLNEMDPLYWSTTQYLR